MLDVADELGFAKYLKAATPTFEEHGAEVVAATDEMNVLEGEQPGQRFVLLRFDSVQAAEEWYESAGYQGAIPLRRAAANTKFMLLFAS